MSEQELYDGREQTLVKHFILRKYLERFARIVGTFADSITYVDCFSGPWNVRSEDLKDGSFAIALEELRKARTTKVLSFLQASPRVPYEQVWDLALSSPLVWDCDVKNWIQEWRESGSLRIDGMKPRQRVPKLDEGNVLVWQETRNADKSDVGDADRS